VFVFGAKNGNFFSYVLKFYCNEHVASLKARAVIKHVELVDRPDKAFKKTPVLYFSKVFAYATVEGYSPNNEKDALTYVSQLEEDAGISCEMSKSYWKSIFGPSFSEEMVKETSDDFIAFLSFYQSSDISWANVCVSLDASSGKQV
jgi:hypothetical protein